MSKKILMDTGTFYEAVSRAARIAPNKGAAFDRASGILLEVDDEGNLVVRSTNIEITYREVVSPAAPIPDKDHDLRWRVPAGLFDGVLSTIDPHSQLSLEEDGNAIKLKANKKKASISLLDSDLFPKWRDFDADDLSEVDDLATRLKQATWACDPQSVPFAGVHITGQSLIATDRYRLVNVPCKAPVDNPITVPVGLIAPLVSDGGMKIKALERRLLLMPDERTKITTVIYDAPYPEEDKLKSVMRDDFSMEFKVDRVLLMGVLSSMMILVKTERYPTTRLTFSNDSLNLYMNVKEAGEMEDTIDVKGLASSDYVIYFTPSYLVQALAATNSDEVTIRLGPENTRTALIEGENDYRAWIMPRKV